MRSLLSIILVLSFVVVAPWLGNTSESSSDDALLDEGIFIIEEDIKEKEKDLQDLKVVLQSKEVKESIPVAKQAQALERITWAMDHYKISQQKVDIAIKATNIVEKQYYFKEAKRYAEMASGLKRRAYAAASAPKAELALQQQGAAQPKRKGTLQFYSELDQIVFGSEAFQQALAIQRAYVEKVEPQMEDPVGYDVAKSWLTTWNGKTVDVTPVVKAVHKVWGPLKKGPVFKSVPTPGGERYKMIPEATVALSSLETKEQREKVGGVALEVTIDLLSFLGVPGFRSNGPVKVIENPILISLTELYKRILAYTTNQTKWNTLPDELRYPGGIQRIHGFVLDLQKEDVFLVGSPAQLLINRIDIDSLIVGLRSVWAEGLTPAVSLDAFPDAPAGPQYVRVMSVPQDTTFAKIMLDADYAMKRITFGDLKVDVAGFQSHKDLVPSRWPVPIPDSLCWFYPMPLGANDIHISSTERTVLFETGVRLLTETGKGVGIGFVGGGPQNPLNKQVVDLFTAHYEEFERSDQVKPRGIFLRLHGLVDIVTVCKLWSSLGINYPILEKFSFLPLRDLQGTEAVPTYYPGVMTPLVFDGTRTWCIAGGVQIRARASRRSLDQYQDVVTATLEHAVDTFPRKRKFAKSFVLSLGLPRPDVQSGGEIEETMVAGHTALAIGQFDTARTKFMDVTKKDPFYADAWIGLALAESILGNHEAAVKAIGEALAEDPGEPEFYMIALHISMQAGSHIDLSDWDESILLDLSNEFTLQSLFALSQDQDAEAKEYADKAIALWEDNPDAYYFRAIALAGLGSEKWTKDMERAIRLYRKQIRLTGDATNKHRLAFALAWRAKRRLFDIHSRDLDKVLLYSVETEAVLYQLQRAVDDAREAGKLDASLPLAPTIEAEVRAQRTSVFRALERSWDLTPAQQVAERVTEKFPDYSPGHRAKAMILALLEKYDEAISAISEAIRLDPTLHGALPERAALHAHQGNCEAASADLRRAKELGMWVPSEIEESVQQCH